MMMRAPGCHGDGVGHFGEGVLRPPVPGEENIKSDAVRPESYEPEGRASPDHAHPSWAESLKALLDDQDGIALFRDFLAQEGCTDVIDFWLACSGFRLAYCAPPSCSSMSTDVLDKRRLKLAKAIYRKYIIGGGIVAKQIKAVTKSSIRERVRHTQLDSTLFEQARQEVQEAMEVEVYPIFLKSDVFLAYTREICAEQENHKWELNSHKQETGNDKKELINSEQEPNSKQEVNFLTPETGNDKQELNSPIQEAGSCKKELTQKTENDNQEVPRFLPELVEKREWVESEKASANHRGPEHWEAGYKLKHRIVQGCVRALPHKTSLLHKLRNVHTEPHKFAADLISRLELVQRERENWRRLEAHLHPICTQEEDDDAEVSTASSVCPAHLSPAHRGSSHSTVQWYKLKHRIVQGCVRAEPHKTSLLHKLRNVHTEPHKFAADLISRLELVQRERENWRRLEAHLHPICTQEEDDDAEVSTASSVCPAHLSPAHRGSSHSTVQWCDTHAENPELILDEHVPPSWRSPTIHTHSHTCPKSSDTCYHGDMAGTNQSEALGYSSRRKCVCESMTVAYYFCGEPIPYRTTVKGRVVTLAHFRELLTKKGAYRFFFKKASDEFDCGVVYEEVCEDAAVLPVFEGRIIGKVERIY
ncbi:hypothetical protein PGIGA_G00164850 [Pangasianodon gigas]|uniref:Uncharacterized protein n=1 Tax=Pangasianodon gigas TaxID=30993 RepID=A0ACC5XSL7_PANGG|nr:hypothetical protein [Pangasianodon gigas]